MPDRADILSSLPRQWALALAISGMLAGAAPAAAQETAQPTPRELWQAYPLDGGAKPQVRLPAGSEARDGSQPVASTRSGSGGGSGVALPIGAGVGVGLGFGVVALLSVLLLGRRGRGVPAASAPGASAAADPPLPPHATAELPPPQAPPAVTPEPPPPEPEPATLAADPLPSPLRAAPEPLPAAPPTALDLEVERLRSGRFERQPWPQETNAAWRCEIGWHAGTLSSGFRAMAAEPGRRRTREVGRSEPQRLWGAAPPEPPTAELVAAADRLAAALLDAGWEPVEGGGDAWYATRFAWPHDEPPPRRLRVRPSPQEVPHGA